MAVTITPVVTDNLGGATMVVAEVKFDSSYPTGGESITPKALGLSNIQAVIPAPAGGYVFDYDYTNDKLKAMYADYDATADGALVQVANEADLSAVTCRVVVFGR